MDFKQWNDFNGGAWQNEINVRDFIQQNYTEYTGVQEELIVTLS